MKSLSPIQRLVCLLAVLLLASLTGCQSDTINSHYGAVDEAEMRGSVNGTGVLAEMFQRSGHHVSSTSWLTPRLNENAEVIVWFPDSYATPPQAVQDWFENWLVQPGHTLVYVGRDYNASPAYWTTVSKGAPADVAGEIYARLQEALRDEAAERSSLPAGAKCNWFTTASQPAPRSVTTLAGPWSQGINPAAVEIELNSRLRPADEMEILLKSDRDPLISRKTYPGESQIILDENGSFLLNLPLVNHEHRKLAGKLIAEMPEAANVVFLESGEGGPEIRETELNPSRTGLEVFGLAPFDSILLHLAIAGVILCLTRWPIFGPPRPMPTERQSDFGEHITALGKLLQRSGDRTFAAARVTRYYEQQRSTTDARGPRAAKKPPAPPTPPVAATTTESDPKLP